MDPLALIEVQSQAIGHDGLDDITVRTDEVGSVRAEPGIPFPRPPPGAACRTSTRLPDQGTSPRSGALAPPATVAPAPASSVACRSSPRSGVPPPGPRRGRTEEHTSELQ